MFIDILKKYAHKKDGATAVEFAIVAVLFITFMIGIFETGRALWIMNRMQFAVETATRTALTNVDITDGEIEDIIDDQMQRANVSMANITVTVNNPTAGGILFKEVIAVYDFQTLTGYLPGDWGNFDVTSTSRIPLPTE